MRICVIAGMIDAKLHSKIAPLQAIDEVTQIDLIRRQPYAGDKITCHSPPEPLLRWLPFAELWRFSTLILLAIFKRPDALIAFGTVPHGVYAWWIGKLFRIPVVQHIMGKNDLRLTTEDKIGQKITLSAIKNADLVAVRGKHTRDWLSSKGVASNKIFIPQNIHDFSLFTPSLAAEPEFDLIYVGLLEKYKSLTLLIETIDQVRTQKENIRLLLVGDGAERQALEKQIEERNLADNVFFAGKIEFSELPRYFQQAKIFIMTSQGEGLPMAMIEAMSCGLPAIVSADADIEEVAKHNINACVVTSPTPEHFTKAILALYSDDKLYETLRTGALKLREEKSREYSLAFQTNLWRTTLINTTHPKM